MGLSQPQFELQQAQAACEFRPVRLMAGADVFEAGLCVHGSAKALVLVAHDPRSVLPGGQQGVDMASGLVAEGMAVMQVDAPDVIDGSQRNEADAIGQWVSRLTEAARWARTRAQVWDLPQGLLGTGQGAAAAFEAAAALDGAVGALVVLTPRMDLISRVALALNRAPTLVLMPGQMQPGWLPQSGPVECVVRRLPVGAENKDAQVGHAFAEARDWLARNLIPA